MHAIKLKEFRDLLLNTDPLRCVNYFNIMLQI